MTSTLLTRASFPEKLEPLFHPARYKVVHGGRGGAKSWNIARAFLCLGTQQPERFLCTREIQKSIKDSVHRLLSDQIDLLQLGDFYTVLEHEIRGQNGTLFLFTGLSDQTAETLKSYEGITKVWVEEAQAVTKRSWNILIPTIRKDDSEIWISFNPELDTDETYVRFVVAPPPNAVVIQMNYRDNPWFPKVLEDERLHCLATAPDDYQTIWEGRCRAAVVGAIYAKEVEAIYREGRYAPCPYDPRLKVHTVWDMGWNDANAIGLVQRGLSECRFIAYYEDSYKKTDVWAAELNKLNLNWGWDWLPFDAFNQDRRSGGDDADILRRFGRKVKPRELSIPKHDPELGIRAARQLLAKSYFNKGGPGIDRLLECAKRYRRHIPKTTNEPASPVHDEFSHGCDMVRHTAMIIEKLTNDDEQHAPVMRVHVPFDNSMGALGARLLPWLMTPGALAALMGTPL